MYIFVDENFPKDVSGLKDLCQTLKDKASTVCDIRLTVSDLLAQMVYEGGVKVISDDGKKFTFDSPEGVAWLQMYVDMVKAGTVDNSILTSANDREGLLLFSAGQAPFYQTGPNLIREVKSNNSQLYSNLAVVQAPIGKSGVAGKGSMGISVKADTKFPNASIALAQYFTNARSMVEFAKTVSIYPSVIKSYDDPAEIDVDIPGFLAKLGKEHDHEGTCTFCGEELHVKPKRPRLKGDERAKRKTITVKLPDGVTGADWDDLLAEAETVEQDQEDTQYEQWRGGIAIGKLLVAVLERFTGRAG